ncbi:MAG: type IV toxin-antitoxin system AbiEi family antitoxin domain-containing protein [Thermoanaerobaculia bacterium]
MATTTPSRGGTPDWDALFEVAQGQAGYFTTRQAASAGYSPQLLAHFGNKRVERVRRGIYRLVHFPAGAHEDLIVLWLWAEQAGVFSHETALALHDLSDSLPGKVHLTMPPSWRRRRLRLPAGLVLHFAEIGDVDCASYSAVPVTAPLRTLRDCIEANVADDLVRQGILQARRRGIVSAKDEARVLGELGSRGRTRVVR